jgi:hypothetical protein
MRFTILQLHESFTGPATIEYFRQSDAFRKLKPAVVSRFFQKKIPCFIPGDLVCEMAYDHHFSNLRRVERRKMRRFFWRGAARRDIASNVHKQRNTGTMNISFCAMAKIIIMNPISVIFFWLGEVAQLASQKHLLIV